MPYLTSQGSVQAALDITRRWSMRLERPECICAGQGKTVSTAFGNVGGGRLITFGHNIMQMNN